MDETCAAWLKGGGRVALGFKTLLNSSFAWTENAAIELLLLDLSLSVCAVGKKMLDCTLCITLCRLIGGRKVATVARFHRSTKDSKNGIFGEVNRRKCKSDIFLLSGLQEICEGCVMLRYVRVWRLFHKVAFFWKPRIVPTVLWGEPGRLALARRGGCVATESSGKKTTILRSRLIMNHLFRWTALL